MTNILILLIQYHFLSRNSDKKKNFEEVFLAMSTKLFLFFSWILNRVYLYTSTLQKSFDMIVSLCVYDVKLIFFDVSQRKPHCRNQNTRCHLQFV